MLNYCYWICKHSQVLSSSDCFFIVNEKHSKLYVSVCVVIVLLVSSMTTRRHCVRAVNDYIDTQFFNSIQSQYIVTFLFFIFQSKILYHPCRSSRFRLFNIQMGPMKVEIFGKKGVENLVTLSL